MFKADTLNMLKVTITYRSLDNFESGIFVYSKCRTQPHRDSLPNPPAIAFSSDLYFSIKHPCSRYSSNDFLKEGRHGGSFTIYNYG